MEADSQMTRRAVGTGYALVTEASSENAPNNTLPCAVGAIGTVGAGASAWMDSPMSFLGGSCATFTAIILWNRRPSSEGSPSRSRTIEDILNCFHACYRQIGRDCRDCFYSKAEDSEDDSEENVSFIPQISIAEGTDQAGQITDSAKQSSAEDEVREEEDAAEGWGWGMVDSNISSIPSDTSQPQQKAGAWSAATSFWHK